MQNIEILSYTTLNIALDCYSHDIVKVHAVLNTHKNNETTFTIKVIDHDFVQHKSTWSLKHPKKQ